MPRPEKHAEQQKRNHQVYDYVCADCPSYSEWAITTMFYVAVHMVAEFLEKKNRKPRSHEHRQKALIAENKGAAADTYAQLLNTSNRARYYCSRFEPHQISFYEQLVTKTLRSQLD